MKHGHFFEALALFLPIQIIARRGHVLFVALSRITFPNRYQAIWVLEWKRPEQHRVDDTENRGVRADAEREREHGHGREAGVLQQLAEGEAEIVHGGCHWSVVRCQLLKGKGALLRQMYVAAESRKFQCAVARGAGEGAGHSVV